MNAKVESFLNKAMEEEQDREKKYRYLVMEYAGLLSDEKDYCEVTRKEYYDQPEGKKENGKYYLKKPVPLDIPDEEFSAVEAAIPKEKLEDFRLKAAGAEIMETGKSNAAVFLTVLGWLIWIGGLIISFAGAGVTRTVAGYFGDRTVKEFSFLAFISAFITYLVSGALCLCAAELFRKLQAIVNLLRRK